MSHSESRRHFFKLALGFSGLALLAPKIVFGEEKRATKPSAAGATAGGDLALPQVKPGVGMAASLKYVEKASDLKEAGLKTDRQGVPFAQQTCSKCMLYTPAGKKDGNEVGKCSLFSGQLVKSAGWCQSWTKKA